MRRASLVVLLVAVPAGACMSSGSGGGRSIARQEQERARRALIEDARLAIEREQLRREWARL